MLGVVGERMAGLDSISTHAEDVLSLFHVVFPSRPNGVLQTCCQKFGKPALLSFSPASSEDHLANALVENRGRGGEGCLKVIMVFNLHQ